MKRKIVNPNPEEKKLSKIKENIQKEEVKEEAVKISPLPPPKK